MRVGIAIRSILMKGEGKATPYALVVAGSDASVLEGRPLAHSACQELGEMERGVLAVFEDPGFLILPPIEVDGPSDRDSVAAWYVEIGTEPASPPAEIDICGHLAGSGATVAGAVVALRHAAESRPNQLAWGAGLSYSQLPMLAGATITRETDEMVAEFVILVTEGDGPTEAK